MAQERHPADAEAEVTAPPRERVYACEHVFSGLRPVAEVLRDEDGDLQALCNEAQHGGTRPRIMAWGCLCERDPSLRLIGRLQSSHAAYRAAPAAPWIIEPIPPAEDEPLPATTRA